MRRSSDLTGGLLIVCGVACGVSALVFWGEGPTGFGLSPRALGLWSFVLIAWGARFIAKTRNDGTGALTGAVRMLQPLTGRTETEVRKWLGAPHATTDAPDGARDLMWNSPGYSITLRFRDGICSSIVQEVTRQPPT